MAYSDRWEQRQPKAWHIFIRTDKGWATPNVQFRTEQEAQIEAALQQERNPDITQRHVQFCKPSEARTLARQWNERRK